MTLVFPNTFYQWAKANPMVWWAAQARWPMGRIAPCDPPGWEIDPTIELTGPDDTSNLTGNRVLSDPRIDVWDRAIMAVCVAGWQYALSLGDDGPGLAAYQAEKDAAALTTLLGRVQSGEITMADAEDAIRAEIRRQAEALEVDISFVDAVDDPEEIELP